MSILTVHKLASTFITPYLLSPVTTRSRLIRSKSWSKTARRASVISASVTPSSKKRVVFLGTPQVSANTLQTLYDASTSDLSTFTVVGVVTQPPAPVGRKRQLTKAPVHQLAEDLNLNPILIPDTARNETFLKDLSALQPDLCITAAYGNFLPKKFLSIPIFGTLNIHPSLLPKFRGAAPVPRALQEGATETGVCVLYTVLKMDAGPIVARRVRKLSGDEQAPDLLKELFATGTEALLDILPDIWENKAHMEEQNHANATHAPKLSKEEGRLTFTENAHIVHNKVRAFMGWPGTWADFVLVGEKNSEEVRLKIFETTVIRGEGGMCLGVHNIFFDEKLNCLVITCGDGSVIGARRIQPPGKKVMDARSFWNGLRGKSLQRKRVPYS